jgi:hypothetical protein
MSRVVLSTLLNLTFANFPVLLVVMVLSLMGITMLRRGWEEGVPKLAPRSIVYAELICGVMGVLHALFALGALGIVPIATPLFAGTSVFWFVFYRQLGLSIESAKQTDEERHRLKRGGRP